MLRYQYRLEGADRDWNAPTNQRSVNYASLLTGALPLRGPGRRNRWRTQPEPATVAFTILPPIWQRAWFLTLAALLVTAGASSSRTGYRVARLLALERVRMRIAADLHDDIGGSLSRISIQSEVACREAAALGEQPARRLMEIADSARGLVDALGDVVWSVDPRRDDLASVCRRLREYADDLFAGSGRAMGLRRASQSRARQAGSAGATTSVPAAQGGRHQHRAARVGPNASFEIRADGTVSSARSCVTTARASTRAPARRRSRIGTASLSMRARAEQLGARLTIESSPGTGTTIVGALAARRAPAAHVHALVQTAEVNHDDRPTSRFM